MSQSSNIKNQIENIDSVLLPNARTKLGEAKEVIAKAPGIINDQVRLDQQGGCPDKLGAKNARERKKKATEIDKCQREARAKQSLWQGKLAKARADLKEAESEISFLMQTRELLQGEYQTALANESRVSQLSAESQAYEQTRLADLGLSFTAGQIEAEARGEALKEKSLKQVEVDAEISAKKAKVRRNVTILISVAVVIIGGFWAWNKFKK